MGLSHPLYFIERHRCFLPSTTTAKGGDFNQIKNEFGVAVQQCLLFYLTHE